jgi:ubiquinone/menaquinone biosynthesis C-methylase UbiE
MGTDIVRIYSRWSFAYDAWTYLTERRSLATALERASLVDGQAVLEVAVGTGWLFRDILRCNPSGRNVGVDLAEPMLRRARARASRTGVPCELVPGDARALPFPDRSFDVVVSNNLLGLLPHEDIEGVLKEVRRVLRASGRLVVVTMQRPLKPLGRLVYVGGAVMLGGWRDVAVSPHVRRAGFIDVEVERVEQLGIPSEVLVARSGP